MAQLRQDYEQFVQRDAEVIVVGPEHQEAFAVYWQKEAFPFVGLADPDHRVANLYRQQVKLLRMGRMPALLVIDQDGQIRASYYGSSMSDIAPNREVLRVLDAINAERAQPNLPRVAESPSTESPDE